jgi:hypothetical protein
MRFFNLDMNELGGDELNGSNNCWVNPYCSVLFFISLGILIGECVVISADILYKAYKKIIKLKYILLNNLKNIILNT